MFLDNYSGTTSMSYIRKSWILLFAVSFPLRSELSEYVSVECNKTVTAVAGDTATLNCTIFYHDNKCICTDYWYSNKPNNILKNYTCKPNATHVSVTISNVTMNETYDVAVRTNCDINHSTIEVTVKPRSPLPGKDEPDNPENSKQDPNHLVMPVLLSTVIPVCVLGILCFLLGRKIVKRIMPKKHHEISVAHTDEEEFLSASQTLQP